MTDIIRAVEIDREDRYRVSVSADGQSFNYEISLYPPDGGGGLKDGRIIGYGDSAHSQWVGVGSEIEGALVRVRVTHNGNSASASGIHVRLDLERWPGVVEHLQTWEILKGLSPGEVKSLTLQFK